MTKEQKSNVKLVLEVLVVTVILIAVILIIP
jgi:hypothetical protein